jgi:hypothetical protein
MKAIAIVIGLVLALMPMAFAQQPAKEDTTMDIEAALPIIGAGAGVLGIVAGVVGIGTGIVAGVIDFVVAAVAGLIALFGFNIPSVLGTGLGGLYTLCVDIQSTIGTAIGGIVSAIGTLAGACWALCTPLYAVAYTMWVDFESTIGTLAGVALSGLGTLWAGFNDMDLTSYMFQATKIIAFACFEPLLYIWNCFGLIHAIPCFSWILAVLHGFAQLGLLCGNLCLNLIQHIAPIV